MGKSDLPSLLVFEETDIERVIRCANTYAQAADALAQIRKGREDEVPNADGLNAAADVLGDDRAEFWVEALKRKNCLNTFVTALRARGLVIETWQLHQRHTMFDDLKLAAFLAQARSFRCKIRVEGVVKGSGILVGPSSALTAWHVIAVAGPDEKSPESPDIDVELADGRTIPAVITPGASPCGSGEWPPGGGRAPSTDADVKDRHDVALLRLKQPAGIHLAYAALASPSYEYGGPAAVVLISHPDGEWLGVEFAQLRKLRNLSARWGYNVTGTSGGSSGGGCFDTSFSLAGIHQGRALNGGRLVPLVRFDGIVRELIENDEVPRLLWSLDGTPDSGLVVGRDAFFAGYHAAMRGASRARGIWVRRVDLKQDVSGLPFAFEMLDALVARSPETRLIRISFDALVRDLPDEIARRASEAGLATKAPEVRHGVGVDQAEPEAVVADRSRRLAQALNIKAAELKIRLWIFFDHPSAVFGDESRWAITAFVDEALRLEHLRIALAGYEAIQMPGATFESEFDAHGQGAPGLMLEYLSDVSEIDVRNLVTAAAREMGRAISPERVTEWTTEALNGLTPINGRYDGVLRGQIAARLQPRLQQLCAEESIA